ncbi:MAG: hypothetical protein IKN30_04295 [Synergistaceae bacterium]|nr:hypothetical protein [Synergistaceae bacterium]
MARYVRSFTPEEPEEDNDEYYDLEEDDDFSGEDEDTASLFCRCQNTSPKDEFSLREIKNLWERSLGKLHKLDEEYAWYVYFKEKIPGKKSRNEKKNNFYWLENDDLYREDVQSAVDEERDYWISAAEVSTPLRNEDDDGKPIFREGWVTSMPCHFLILDLEEAGISENLNLDFYLSGEQMTELVLEHCRHRGLPEPIIWGDHEELFVVWPLKVPYEKGRYGYENNRGRLVLDKKGFVFNLDWNEVQNLLYEDFKYLGANPTKKHALTMLRVPGTFNSHANTHVRVFHDAEKTTRKEIKNALAYVRDRLERYKPIRHPDFQAKLEEFQKENEEFLNFCNAIDGTQEAAPKPKDKKSKWKFATASKAKKARIKREHSQQKRAKSDEQDKKHYLEEIEKLSSQDSPEAAERRKWYEEKLADLEKKQSDRDFLKQIREDVLRIHLASDNYVCLCFKGEKESWRQIFVHSKNLEKKLIELKSEPDFDRKNIYVSQAKFLSDKSRAVDNVASLSVSFLDIDGKLAAEHKDLTPEEWANLIVEHCREKEIPLPGIIVFSGNGLHVKWLYRKAITREKLDRWAMLQKKLWLIFKDFGADAQAKDAARVLRLPGTKNCKPDTVDRDVRVVYSNPERYSFEDFAKKIFNISGYDESTEFYEEFKPKVAEVITPEVKEIKEAEETKVETLAEIKTPTPAPKPTPVRQPEILPFCGASPYFKVKNETTGEEKFLKKSEMPDYLKSQEKTHLFKRSITDFEQPDSENIGRIYCNYAVLSAKKVPGANLKEKSANILKRCAEYWNGLGIHAPNGLMSCNGKIIIVWKYFDYLPAVALPRWQRTQEIIGYHFADWGSKDELEYQDISALLPIANQNARILRSKARYKFDDLANLALRFSQDEVREYKKKKAEEKAKAQAERTLKNLAAFKRKPKKQNGSFAGMAKRRFDDIMKLIELRKDHRGEVPQGHRELSVFWAMVFAVQGGLVSNMTEFDALNQKLIDANGIQFHNETELKTFASVKKRFINNNLYKAKTETLIDALGITTAEQVELEVLRYFPKKEKKPKKPSIASLKPWLDEGISCRTWYRHRKAEREALNKIEEAKKEKISTLSPKITAKIEEIFIKNFASRMPMKTTVYEDGTTFSYIMGGGESLIIKHREVDKNLQCSLWCRGSHAVLFTINSYYYSLYVSRIRLGGFDNSYSEFIMDFRFRTAGGEKRIRCVKQLVKNLETGPNRARLYFAFLVRPPPRYEGGNSRLINF